MIRISFRFFFRHKWKALLQILCLCGISFVMYFLISNMILANKASSPIFVSYPENSEYISFTSLEGTGVNKSLLKLFQRSDVNQYIGYSMIDHQNTVKSEQITTIYLNKYLSYFKYELSDGTWFGDNLDGVIIRGDICGQYEIGDSIKISLEDGTIVHKKIIGKLDSDEKVMLLNVACESIDYNTITSSNLGNIILTVDQGLINNPNSDISKNAIVADSYYINKLSNFDLDLDSVTKFDDIQMTNASYISNYYVIFYIVLCIIFIVYDNYLELNFNLEIIKTLNEIGTSKYCECMILLLPYFVIMLITDIIVLVYHLVISVDSLVICQNTIIILFLCNVFSMLMVYFVLYRYINHLIRKGWIR